MKRLAILLLICSTASSQSLIQRGGWVTGYFAAWSWQASTSTAKIIGMDCFTHIILAAGDNPDSNGTLNWYSPNGLNMVEEMTPTLEAAGIKTLLQFCCDWSNAVNGDRAAFITNLLNVVADNGMSGIDIDWETENPTGLTTFIADLRDSLDARFGTSPRKLIVAYMYPSATGASYVEPVYADMDQINVQGYDLVGATWSTCAGDGNDYRVTWHQGPCYSGGATCPLGNPMINLNDIAQEYVNAGIPAAKIGISARPNGNVWAGGKLVADTTEGVTLPLQAYVTTNLDSLPSQHHDMPYYGFGDPRGSGGTGTGDAQVAAQPRVHDVACGATYISFDTTNHYYDYFISYDDGWACGRKIKLVQDSLYGGVYVWTIDGMEQIGSVYPQADSLAWWANNYEATSQSSRRHYLLIK